MKTGALFSPCNQYRYRLWREWEEGAGVLAFVMLNPSTADETANDPTVERCQRRAKAMGYRRLEVLNIFAFRSTDPQALYSHHDPVGPANDYHILRIASVVDMIVLGWGAHGALNGRGNNVMDMLRGYKPHALRITKDGHPGHPLYIGYKVQPLPITELRRAA
jgi:hypothetical protein